MDVENAVGERAAASSLILSASILISEVHEVLGVGTGLPDRETIKSYGGGGPPLELPALVLKYSVLLFTRGTLLA